MQTHRIISGLTIFVMVVLIAAGYFLVAQPQLAAASTANSQLVDAQSQITSAQAALVSLKNEQTKLPALKKQLQALQLSIPSDIEGSAYIRGLNDLASTAGVTITGISVSDPQAYVSPIVAAAPAATGTAAPTASPSASASPSPAATTPAVSGWTPTTDALITGSNFVDIPVTVTISGAFDASLNFIKGLQTGTRLFLVTGITTKQADDGSGTVTTEVTGYIYALIDPKAAAAEAAAEKAASASPTPTPTPTATATSTATPNPSGSSTPTPTTSPTPTK
jgi:Tfp pilus assembly protein PilO